MLYRKALFSPIYKKNIHYNLGKIQKKKEMYRQKSVIFTIGKILYIRKGWAKTKKEKCLISLYIRKSPIEIPIYKENTQILGQNKEKERGSYI